MFDLDYLTDSMNCIPVSVQNQANPADSKEVIDIDVQTEEAADLMVVSSTSLTKHIEIRHHFIRDCYEKKLISVEKIHTDLNVADLLTKPFDGPRFNYLVINIAKLEANAELSKSMLGSELQGEDFAKR
ncbi:hypothetical protein Tco_0372246, partial [Tanacetum coccineum]